MTILILSMPRFIVIGERYPITLQWNLEDNRGWQHRSKVVLLAEYDVGHGSLQRARVVEDSNNGILSTLTGRCAVEYAHVGIFEGETGVY